jgi:hypothetical protein
MIFRYAILTLSLFLAGSQALGQSSKDLLDVFCAHQEAARSRLQSFSLTIETNYSGNNKAQTLNFNSVCKEIHQENSRWIENTRKIDAFNKNDNLTLKYDDIQSLVINDDYVATWDKGIVNAYLYENSEKQKATEDGDTAVKLAQSVDLMKFGYGDGDRMLSEAIADLSIDGKWNARPFQSQSGQSLYIAERISTHGDLKDKPELQCVIDPQKSFLITRVVAYHPNGAVRIDDEIDIQEVKPGVYFPMHLVMRSYANNSGDDFSSLSSVSLDDVLSNRYLDSYGLIKNQQVADHRVTELETDIDIKPEQFTMNALGVPANVDLIKKASDGTLTVLKKMEGKWVDEELAESFASVKTTMLAEEIGAEKTSPTSEPLSERAAAQESAQSHKASTEKENASVFPAVAGGVLLFIVLAVVITFWRKGKK